MTSSDNNRPTCSVGAFATDNADYVRLTGLAKNDDRLFDVRMSRGAAETLANEIQGLLARPLAEAMGREFLNPTVKQDHADERGQWWEERKDVARLARQDAPDNSSHPHPEGSSH